MGGQISTPGSRKSAPRCRCCKGSDIERTGDAVERWGMPHLPVRCRSCGFTWSSSALAVLQLLAPEALVQA
jgi:hypothetical protein